MNRANITQEIQAIKALFKNIRDTLSRDEINDIRTKICKHIKLCEYFANKTKLNKKQTNRFNEVINNLNELHEYLLKKLALIIMNPMSLINCFSTMNTINIYQLEALLKVIMLNTLALVILQAQWMYILKILSFIWVT